MLTRFFGTTKPLAIVAVLVYMTIGFYYSNRSLFLEPFETLKTLKITGMWLLFILAMFLLNFITQKNELTKRNAYRTLLFAAFGLALPAALRDGSILLAGVLVLISFRRMISLRSGLRMESKLFDATFWLCLASITYFFSWFFIVAIYVSLLLYRNVNIRYLLIPLVAILTFFLIGYAFILGLDNGSEILAHYPERFSLDFRPYNSLQITITIAFLLGVLIWTLWNYLSEQQRASTSAKARYSVILSILFACIVLIILAPHKTSAEWYFALPVLSIIVSNYLDTSKNILFKESLLWLIVILPVIINFV